MATMREIAALADVSIATVSYVLNGTKKVNEETRLRVLRAVELTNYRPNTIAKSLRMNKTNIIGVLVEDICGLPVPGIVDGIYQQLEASGYQVLLNNLRLLQSLFNQYDKLSQYTPHVNDGIQLLENARVEGIIYVAMHDRQISGINKPVDIPMVYAYSTSSDPDSISVLYDNESSAYELTKLLIAHGHRRIALLGGHASSQGARLRLIGYHRALSEAGLTIPPEYIRWGDWAYQSGVALTEQFLSLTVPPSAIFAMNDLMAAGTYAAIRQRGLRVPDDISVVGFDNIETASYLYPSLTTVALPNTAIGNEAAKQLLLRLNGKTTAPSVTTLPCSIVERNSVRVITE